MELTDPPPLSESHPRKRMKMERYADDGDTRAYKERMGEVDMTQGQVYSKLLLCPSDTNLLVKALG